MCKFTSLFIIFFIVFQYNQLSAQGCVAIRGFSSCGTVGNSIILGKGKFLAGTGFRYFKSFRHFRGSVEEVHRVEEQTEVINHSYFLDLSVNYGLTNRIYLSTLLPFVFHTRSSMYEHGGNPPNGLGERHETSSKGLADMRLSIGYWLFNPEKFHNFNYAIGLGVKLPTGKYDYMDIFYNQGNNRNENRLAVVDQSIQPGDGGTGITLDIQGYHILSHAFVFSTNLYYLFNFQETNHVLTRNGRSEFSCADQYAARLGLYYNIGMTGFSAYLGGRMEGVPAYDLIGESSGYRRPGYAVSIEPGISYNHGNYSVNFSLPIAIVRNRTQSFEDRERTMTTGVYRHGDAAFADYLVNFNFSYRFEKKKHHMPMEIPSPDSNWPDIKKNNQ